MNDVQPLPRAACQHAELLDVGVGTGKWLLREAIRLGIEHPVGVDLNPGKVARAQAAGLPVYQSDFADLDPTAFPAVKVVVLDNVLEHLPSSEAAEGFFARACAIASHVVHIRHPSFEHEDYLAAMGLKQYWTDWPGVHTAHIRLHEFVAMAERNGVYDFSVRGLMRATGSDDPTILPASAPPNQRKAVRGPGAYGAYDESRHGPKPSVVFDRPVYFAFDLFFFLRSDAPTVQYRVDTDDAVARAHLLWPGASQGRSGPRVKRLLRRARGA